MEEYIDRWRIPHPELFRRVIKRLDNVFLTRSYERIKRKGGGGESGTSPKAPAGIDASREVVPPSARHLHKQEDQ